MTERRVPITPVERALLRRRAIVVLPVALAIGGVTAWMLGWVMPETLGAIRLVFGVFFGFVLLVIVGGHLGAAFEQEKLVRTGVVTEKRVGVVGASMSSNTRVSPRYYVSLDGEELSVEQWVYSRVHVGETAEFSYTARLKVLFDVAVVADPLVAELTSGAPRPFELNEVAHTEALTLDDRAALRAHLLRAAVRRVGGGLLLGGLVWTVFVVGWAMVRSSGGTIHEIDQLILLRLPELIAVLLFVALNRHTWRLFRDLSEGVRRVDTERIHDVVRSNTPLPSPNSVVTGTGLAGDYLWVQTSARWAAIDASLGGTLTRGGTLEVITAPRSGVELAVGGVPTPRVGLGLIDLVVALGVIGGFGCCFSGGGGGAPG